MDFYQTLQNKIEKKTGLKGVGEKQSGDIKSENTFTIKFIPGEDSEEFLKMGFEDYEIRIFVNKLRTDYQEWKVMHTLVNQIQDAIKSNLGAIGISESDFRSARRDDSKSLITEIILNYTFKVIQRA